MGSSTAARGALSDQQIAGLAQAYIESGGKDEALVSSIQDLIQSGQLDSEKFMVVVQRMQASQSTQQPRSSRKPQPQGKPPTQPRQASAQRQRQKEPPMRTRQKTTTSSPAKSLGNWLEKLRPWIIALVVAGVTNSILSKAGATTWVSVPAGIMIGLSVAFPPFGKATVEVLQKIMTGIHSLILGHGRSLTVGFLALYFFAINCESWWMAMPGSQGAFIPKPGINAPVSLSNLLLALGDWKFYVGCFIGLAVNAIETLWLVDRPVKFLNAQWEKASGVKLPSHANSSAAIYYQNAMKNSGMKHIRKTWIIAAIAFLADTYGSWQQFPLFTPSLNGVHLIWGILVLVAPEGCFAIAKSFYEESKHER